MLVMSNTLRFSLENEGPEILGAQVMICSSHWSLRSWRTVSFPVELLFKGTSGALDGSVQLDSSNPQPSAFPVYAAGIWIPLC